MQTSHQLQQTTSVRIPINHIKLDGDLVIPSGAQGIVVFAHGSGSSRQSPRNQFVAEQLQQGTMATLLVDLLSVREDLNYQTRFDIDLLTERLIGITDWVEHDPRTEQLALGFFGASTGAAAAIRAAVELGDTVHAVVSRGGRVDLAYDSLHELQAPTLLIVGQADYEVLQLNKAAFNELTCEKKLATIPNATHLFEEPGVLERVADLATSWFKQHCVQ